MKFSTKLSLFFLLISIFICGVIAYLSYKSSVQNIKNEILFRLEDDAFHIMDKIDRMLFERFSDVKVFATDPIISSPDSLPQQITERLIEFRNQYKVYASLSFFNSQGLRIADTNSLNIGEKSEIISFWIAEFFEKGVVSLLPDIRVSESLKMPVAHFAAPVKDNLGQVLGVVVSRMPLSKLYGLIKKVRLELEQEPLKIDLVNRQGLLLYSSYNRAGILKDNLADWEAVKRSLAGEDRGNLLHYDVFSKQEDLLVFVRQKGFLDFSGDDWTLLVHFPLEKIVEPAIDLRNKIFIIAGIIIIFSIFVVILLSRSIAKPVIKLRDAAYQVGKGNLDVKVDVKSKDELGDLTRSFNIMADDLKQAREQLVKDKEKLKEWSVSLEKKVNERTKDLSQFQVATINMLEDLEETRDDLEESNLELRSTKDEVERFSRVLEERVKERTAALSVLYDVSRDISYSLDYRQLFKIIMEALLKIVDYDVCASILFDAHTADIILKPAYPADTKFVDEVKTYLIKNAVEYTEQDINEKRIDTFIVPPGPYVVTEKKREVEALESFFNVPLTVRGRVVGLFSVLSCKKDAFSREDAQFINTVANQVSSAIERLRGVLTTEKSKMESMVASMVEGVIMLDKAGRILVLNPRARELLRFDTDKHISSEVLQNRFKTIELEDCIKECQSKNAFCVEEIIVPNKEGGETFLRSEISPVKDEEGSFIGLLVILRDITREKEVDRMKTEFISTVSHELRTPLSILKEGVSLVLAKIPGQINEKQEKVLTTVKGNIDRLARIINNLLDISKIEVGRMELRRQVVDVKDLIEGVVSSFESKTKEKRIELIRTYPGEKIEIFADPDRIIQIFLNLLGNAVKFTETGYIEVYIRKINNEVECGVIDTGVGVAEEDLPRLFDKFQQFGRVAGGGEKGTGLGLSIAKEIVELHGGSIWVESPPSADLMKPGFQGVGTKLSFTLPRYLSEHKYIEQILEDLKKKDLKGSFFIVSVDDFDRVKKEVGVDRVENILKDIYDVLKGSFRREGDVVFRDFCEFVIFLSGCDKQSILQVKRRLERSLKDYLVLKGVVEQMNLKFGCATFPDDGGSSEELIHKAKI
jgi:PAS domain S-box-containing protein